MGPCEIRSSGGDLDFGTGGASLDAGPITVDVAGVAYSLTLSPGGGGSTYASDFPGGTELFAAGAPVTVTAAGGGDVSGFAGTLTAPAEPVIASPTWSLSSTHDRGTPLPVRWGGGPGDLLVINILPVEVFPEPGVADGNNITCTVPDTGSFDVPAEALGYLPEGDGFGGGSVALTLVRMNNVVVEFDGASVTLNGTASHTIVGGIP